MYAYLVSRMVCRVSMKMRPMTRRSTLMMLSMVKKLTIKLTMNKKTWSEPVARWSQMIVVQTMKARTRSLLCKSTELPQHETVA